MGFACVLRLVSYIHLPSTRVTSTSHMLPMRADCVISAATLVHRTSQHMHRIGLTHIVPISLMSQLTSTVYCFPHADTQCSCSGRCCDRVSHSILSSLNGDLSSQLSSSHHSSESLHGARHSWLRVSRATLRRTVRRHSLYDQCVSHLFAVSNSQPCTPC